MGIREILGALGRRWYIVVVGLILSLGAGWFVYDSTPPDYTARGLVLLLPPPGEGEQIISNPFLALGGLELPARVLVATYSSTSFAEELEEVSPDAEVEVAVDDSTSGPVIAISVKDRGAEQALTTLDYVVGTVDARLQTLQNEVGVAATAAVRTMPLTIDTEAEPDFESLTRVLVIAVGGGIAVTLVVALVVDAMIGRRRRRRMEPLSGGTPRYRPQRSPTPAAATAPVRATPGGLEPTASRDDATPAADADDLRASPVTGGSGARGTSVRRPAPRDARP